MLVRYSVLGSGSCGNSYIFTLTDPSGKEPDTSIMVDAGYSMKKLRERMAAAGTDAGSVRALFLTHLHPDHAHAAGILARQLSRPVYVSRKCRDYGSTEYHALRIPEGLGKTIEPGRAVQEGPFLVECFHTSHDSAGSVGYRIAVGDKVFVIVTDTGIYNQTMVEAGRTADILFLESNYDDWMLRHGPYPVALQRRVAGERGHLSNDQARSFLCDAGFEGSGRPVYLIHLSVKNNTVDIVRDVMKPFNATVCARGEQYSGEIAVNISENGMNDRGLSSSGGPAVPGQDSLFDQLD